MARPTQLSTLTGGKLYGLYSATQKQHSEKNDTAVEALKSSSKTHYELSDEADEPGRVVEVTHVCVKSEADYQQRVWPDTINYGPVYRFVNEQASTN